MWRDGLIVERADTFLWLMSTAKWPFLGWDAFVASSASHRKQTPVRTKTNTDWIPMKDGSLGKGGAYHNHLQDEKMDFQREERKRGSQESGGHGDQRKRSGVITEDRWKKIMERPYFPQQRPWSVSAEEASFQAQ